MNPEYPTKEVKMKEYKKKENALEIYNNLISYANCDRKDWKLILSSLEKSNLRKKYIINIANSYLEKKIFPNRKIYEIFSKKIDTNNMIIILSKSAINDFNHKDLLLYYALPSVKKYTKTNLDKEKIVKFVDYIKNIESPKHIEFHI